MRSKLLCRIDSAVLDAISAEMAAYGARRAGRPLPDLAWFLQDRSSNTPELRGLADGLFGHWTPDVVRPALQAWADVLGLDPDPDAHPGTVRYRGTLDDGADTEVVPVEVWGVVARDLWTTFCLRRRRRAVASEVPDHGDHG